MRQAIRHGGHVIRHDDRILTICGTHQTDISHRLAVAGGGANGNTGAALGK